MENQNQVQSQSTDAYYSDQDESKLKHQAQRQAIFEGIYRFFYAIWPSVNNFFIFIFYHTLRIIRGAVRTALEQFKQGI